MSKLNLDTVYHVNRQFMQDCELLRKDVHKACNDIFSVFGGKDLERTDPVVATVFRRIEEFENCWGPEVEKIVKCAELEQQQKALESKEDNFASKNKAILKLHAKVEDYSKRLNDQDQVIENLINHIKMLEERLELLGGDS